MSSGQSKLVRMSLDEYNELIASKTFLGEQVRASELSASTSIGPPKAHMFGIARLTHQAAKKTFQRIARLTLRHCISCHCVRDRWGH